MSMKRILIILIFAYSTILYSKENNLEISFKKGISLYKKATCNSCHFWHANGGNSHGGSAPSLRTTILSKSELLTVIKCGRYGTNMPFFSRNYKIDKNCAYINTDINSSNKMLGLKGAILLREKEINYLVTFIKDEIQNKPLTKQFCIGYFNKNNSICEKLK